MTLADQIDAIVMSMSTDMLINRWMRPKILRVLAIAILAFDHDGTVNIKADPVPIDERDWVHLDEAFADGIWSRALSEKQRSAWRTAYLAARRVITDK